jgi:hypothetical protein
MLPLVIAALLGLSALAVVLTPLYAPSRAATESEGVPPATLAERERAAKAALQDVEFDYQLGNIAEDDYRSLRERYTRRALAALKGRYDRERVVDEAIEAQVAALRTADSSEGRKRPANGQSGARAGKPFNGTKPAAPGPNHATNGRATRSKYDPKRDGGRNSNGQGRA